MAPELAFATQKPGAPERKWPDPLVPENNPYINHNRTLAYDSAPAAHWLVDSFGLDLSIIGTMAGASQARCHRGKERFPGMTITYALMEKYEKMLKEVPDRARLICKARVTSLDPARGGANAVYTTLRGPGAGTAKSHNLHFPRASWAPFAYGDFE